MDGILDNLYARFDQDKVETVNSLIQLSQNLTSREKNERGEWRERKGKKRRERRRKRRKHKHLR